MRRSKLLSLAAIMTFCVAALADPTVTLTLESSKAGQLVPAGVAVDWTIRVGVSTGDNQGLALVCCDLVQDAGNPAFLDLPPADVGSIDATMTNFSRPDGISNPGEGGATTGYVGVQRGTPGQMNLVQLGGGQNTFGWPGTTIGTNENTIGSVGQGGSPQIVASGSFTPPATAGAYTLQLDNALANVLVQLNTPPDFSPVTAATIAFAPASVSFTVSPYGLGDLNCDGEVNNFDIDPFVLALTSAPDFTAYYAQYPSCEPMLGDCNQDGSVNNFDIDPFVDLLTG